VFSARWRPSGVRPTGSPSSRWNSWFDASRRCTASFSAPAGPEAQARYWAIFEELRAELGYADYLGALQRYRVEHPRDQRVLTVSTFMVNYPFANRLYPGSLDVLERFRGWGPAVILSDGDAVFQPRKIERAGIRDAVDDDVLVYVHKEKELDDVERRYPSERYVLVDDKLRILTAASVVLLPLTLIASVFGMNVQFPGEGESITFYLILALMAVLLVALVILFRRRGWL